MDRPPFRELVESSPDLIAFFDLDQRVSYLNDAGRALIGLPEDVDVTTTVVGDYLAPGHPATSSSRFDDLRGAGSIAGTNVLRHWGGGPPIPVDQSLFVVRDAGGEPVAYGTVQRDRRDQARVQEALRHMPDLLVIVDADARLLYASPAATQALGHPEAGHVGARVTRYVHVQDRERVAEELGGVLSQPAAIRSSLVRVEVADGSVRTYEAQANNQLHEPSIGGVVIVCRDVTDRLRHEQAARAQARVLELIAAGASLGRVLGTLADSVEAQLDGVLCSLLLVEDGVLRNVASRGFPPEFRDEVDRIPLGLPSSPCAVASASGKPVLVEDLLADEAYAPFHELARQVGVRSCWSFPVTSPSTGQLLGSCALYRDRPGLPEERVASLMARAGDLIGIAVERQALLDRLAHDAHHDDLTGLPNRVRLLQVLEDALADRAGGPVVVFLGLDRLEVVNDSLGHEVGDELLVRTAERLRLVVPDEHLVARFGGDEFVVLAEGLGTAAVGPFADRLLAAVAQPVLLAGRTITPAASAGVVVVAPEQSATEVLRDADIAMYRAKSAGGSRFTLFGSHMRQRALDRLDLEGQIRHGIEAGEFRVHLQPIVELDSGAVVGFEALVRWQHPERGLLPPAAFIDVAEETGLIVPLGQWVLRAASEAVSRVKVRGLQLSVNVSAVQLASPGLIAAVLDAQERMHPWALCLEVTESTLMEDTSRTRSVIDDLAGLGVTLSIDDFGTGFSSLSYLTRLPFGTLKIDRSFVADLGRSDGAATVAEAVVRLSDGLRLRVIAEGVETQEQREVLRSMGCRLGQGYLFGRPVDPDSALRALG